MALKSLAALIVVLFLTPTIPLSIEEIPPPIVKIAYSAYSEPLGPERPKSCECVAQLREWGLPMPRLDAVDLQPNSTPYVGGVILFKYWNEEQQAWIYHAALIVDITENHFIIKEGNYKRCRVTRREIAFDDPDLRGFFNPLGVTEEEGGSLSPVNNG